MVKALSKQVLLTLFQIFRDGIHFISFLSSQRRYSWEFEQRVYLIESIVSMVQIGADKISLHYIGIILATPKEENKFDGLDNFEIDDE